METVLKNEVSHYRNNNPFNKGNTETSGNGGKYDMVFVGFGPAALAIAIAMRDRGIHARVLFLERQPEFGWHTGMLLPGTKMQISFIKDLATVRDPRSHFTFLNYLHQKDRLVHFTNLSTHTPLREEFNDYMRWCASHFNDWVEYGQEVVSVTARETQPGRPAESFQVVSRDTRTGSLRELASKHVVVATGGEQAMPPSFSGSNLRNSVIHSSSYLNVVPKKLNQKESSYRFAVIGGGQSAVEICDDLSSRYPNSKVDLITKASSLRPSDDSPFVNEIFDPSSVDNFYTLDSSSRKRCLQENKATNYGVVRLPLLESLYERLYRQKFLNPDPSTWDLRVITDREACGVAELLPNGQIALQLKHARTGEVEVVNEKYDLVILATGYKRDPFANILKSLKPIVEGPAAGEKYEVDRNYRVRFLNGKVGREAGVWLQGCCENTHGLSDSLLSILSVRSGELLDAILESNTQRPMQAKL